MYSLFGFYLIRLSLETLSLGKWCKIDNLASYIIYTIIILNVGIFVLQIIYPLIYCKSKPRIIDGEFINLYFDECINHKFTKLII